MKVTRVNPEAMAPATGFSHAVVAEGKFVFLAGQTALNKENQIVGVTIVQQFEQVINNLLKALTAAGGTADNLVKLTIFAVDPQDYRANSKEIGSIWQSLIGRTYPAMTLVGVTRLWDDGALLEIEGIAAL
jgi:enamine deaminase RidA (YjgF/YER057c/UK114 family)